jgi:hypothetical protein
MVLVGMTVVEMAAAGSLVVAFVAAGDNPTAGMTVAPAGDNLIVQ